MARARNIKPAFFDNDQLAEIEPLGRLLFIGLWTIADYKGDVIYREKRIKAQLLPYDDCDVKKIMINLDKSGFVRFYSDGDQIFLNVVNFAKHQNPHKNERDKGSNIPSFSENMSQVVDLTTLTINLDKTGLNPDENETNRADSLSLIPDSPILIPDKPIRESPSKDLSLINDGFTHWWNLYPVSRRKNKGGCLAKFKAKCKKLKDNQEIVDLINAISNDINKRVKEIDDVKFLPATEPYLTQERWKDGE